MSQRRVFGSLDPYREGGDILGRNVANSGFLWALLHADPLDGYHFYLPGIEQIRTLQCEIARFFPKLLESGKIILATRLELPAALQNEQFHVFHLSDCMTAPAFLGRLRNSLAPEIFPITSITHTLSYARYGQAFLAHLWPGCTARDAVLATSTTGREAVLAHYQWLRECYNLDKEVFPQPSVEVLPLGIDADYYQPASDERRQDLRERWDLPPDRTALLVLGRVSHSSKMDLLPLLRALQRLINEGFQAKQFIVLIAGAVSQNDDYPETLKTFAGNLGLELRLLAGPSDQDKLELLQAADMLVSPSDNVQETFGITMLEAQAAGLPVVASDWDGYRNLVEHGVTGFLVPTVGPSSSSLADSLGHLWYDNQQHLLLAQSVAVDVTCLARAIGQLAQDPELCRTMGRAGRRRVEEKFNWPSVIERMIRLWDSLWDRPVDESIRMSAHPLQPPTARIFAGYPTKMLSENLLLRWSRLGQAVYRGQDAYSVYAGIDALIDQDAVRTLVFLARKDTEAGELALRLSEIHFIDQEAARFHILWALKNDLLEQAQENG